MSLCDESFRKFVHPLLHDLTEKNRLFRQRYGLPEHWEWNPLLSVLTFSNAVGPKLCIAATVVGTAQGESWEWNWANPNFKADSRPDANSLDMEKIRAFGEAHEYKELVSAFLDADEDTGWEMTAAAAHILDAPGAYRFPTESGYCYLIYRKIKEIEAEPEKPSAPLRHAAYSDSGTRRSKDRSDDCGKEK